MRLLVETNVKPAMEALRRKRQDIQVARQSLPNQKFAWALLNAARNIATRNSKHKDFFYFTAVDEGRDAIVALKNKTNQFQELHFKIGPGANDWVVTISVDAARPRGITKASIVRLKREIRAQALLLISNGNVPSGREFLKLLELLERRTVEVFVEETNNRTKDSNTKQNYYGVSSTPLASAFFTSRRV